MEPIQGEALWGDGLPVPALLKELGTAQPGDPTANNWAMKFISYGEAVRFMSG
jgi:hypothetical protein